MRATLALYWLSLLNSMKIWLYDFTGISPILIAFLGDRFKISFLISSSVAWQKLKICNIKASMIFSNDCKWLITLAWNLTLALQINWRGSIRWRTLVVNGLKRNSDTSLHVEFHKSFINTFLHLTSPGDCFCVEQRTVTLPKEELVTDVFAWSF